MERQAQLHTLRARCAGLEKLLSQIQAQSAGGDKSRMIIQVLFRAYLDFASEAAREAGHVKA